MLERYQGAWRGRRSLYPSAWRETVLAVIEHVLGVAGSKAAGLGSEVKENGVQFPVAQGMDGCLVDTGDEQGGCAPRAEAVGFHLVRGNVGDVLNSGSSGSQFVRDLGGGDGAESVLAVIIGMEWSFRRGMVLEVEDAMLAGMDGADDGVPREPIMSACFPMGCILLVSVGEGDVYPSLHIMQGTLCGGSVLNICIAKGGVAEVEGLAAAMVGGR